MRKLLTFSLLLLGLPAFAGAQTLTPAPFQTFLDNSGKIVNGGCVWTYLAGTTTAATTYTDAGLTTPNANPIKADSAGRFVAYLTNGVNYKFVYENIPCTAISHGSTLKTVDNIRAVPTADLTSLRQLAEGRLTLTSGTPVTTADVSAATSIFYAPYSGTRIALYDGTASWNVRTFSEVTISISGCTAARPYDIWLYDSSGTVTGEILAWTNTTTRATGLTRQDGIYVKSGDATRRYVGTFYCNSTGGQTDDTAAKRYLSNHYNRVRRVLRRQPTSTWTYTTATVRQAAGSTANQVEVVIGAAESPLELTLNLFASNSAGGVAGVVGIGEDSTTAMSSEAVGQGYLNMTGSGVAYFIGGSRLVKVPAVGWHKYVMLEYSGVGGTTTWYSSDPQGVSASLGGLVGSVEQ